MTISAFMGNSFAVVNMYDITDDFGSIALADYISNRDNCGGSGMIQLMINYDGFLQTYGLVYYEEIMILKIIRNELQSI